MHDLSYFVIADPGSGTFFGGYSAYIFDTRWLLPDELEILNEGSDQQRAELIHRYGIDLENLIDPNTLEKPEEEAAGD